MVQARESINKGSKYKRDLCKSLHTFLGFNVRAACREGLRMLGAGEMEKVSPLHDCTHGCCLETWTEGCDGGMAAEEAVRSQIRPASEAVAEDGEGKRLRRRTEKTQFPPPLRWLTERDGRRSGFMKAERRNGRLILTDMWIEQGDYFRARREDGRLRLYLIESEGADDAMEARGEDRSGE